MLPRENHRRREAMRRPVAFYTKLRYLVFGMAALSLVVYALSVTWKPPPPPPERDGGDIIKEPQPQQLHHLVFLAVSSDYLAEATFPAFHAAPSVYGPINLAESADSVDSCIQRIVQHIKLHDPKGSRNNGRWKTGLVLMPALENAWFWSSGIHPLMHQLTQLRNCRISLVGLREYLPYTIVRGLSSNCNGNAAADGLKRRILSVIDQARIFDRLQPHGLQIDRIERVLEDPYAMERWLVDVAGVYPVGVLPLDNLSGSHHQPTTCVLKALTASLKYIAGLSPAQLELLPALPHLGRWHYVPRTTKIIAITQVRNVAHSLESFLHSLDWIADHIILLDTGSTDGSIGLANNLTQNGVLNCGLTLLLQTSSWDQRSQEWHEGNAYKQLLNAARAMNATHIMTPDSDEYFTYNWRRKNLLRHVLLSLPKGVGLQLRLFHVYHGLDRWISPKPSGWQQLEQAPAGWADDGKAHRAKHRHHISRLPGAYRKISLTTSNSLGMVHFKFASRLGMLAKTVWYRHLEWKQGNQQRANSKFYIQKIPRIGVGSAAKYLKPVPTDAWFGPSLPSLQAWLETGSWAWRLRMVNHWRGQTNASYPFALPKEWKAMEAMVAAVGSSAATERLADGETQQQQQQTLNAIDLRCRAGYHETQVRTSQEGSRRLSNQLFSWVTHDARILGWLTKHETHVRHFVQAQYECLHCKHASPGQPSISGGGGGDIVLDVGANSGFYGLWALAAGYSVIFIEPQPYCAWMLQLSLAANPGFQDRARIIRATAANQTHLPGPGGLPVWCGMTCSGLLGGPGVRGKGKPSGHRGAVMLDDLIKPGQSVAFLKIDTEGAETEVLQGAHRLFASHQIRAAVIEVSPIFYQRQHQEDRLRQQILTEMLWIHAQGYDVFRPRIAHPKDSVRDYQLLETPMQLRSFFMGRNNAFVQYDVFVVLRHPTTTTRPS